MTSISPKSSDASQLPFHSYARNPNYDLQYLRPTVYILVVLLLDVKRIWQDSSLSIQDLIFASLKHCNELTDS